MPSRITPTEARELALAVGRETDAALERERAEAMDGLFGDEDDRPITSEEWLGDKRETLW